MRLIRHIKAVLWVIVLASGSGNSVRAATSPVPIEFIGRNWTKADGLPDNAITSVVQTRNGFLWIGTPAGLVRFDGLRFVPQNFPVASNAAVAITDLCEDTAGKLWIGTRQSGLFCMESNVIRRFSAQNAQIDLQVNCLAVDNSGMLWIGTQHGLNFWDGKQFRHYTGADGLPDETISSVFVARDNSVWVTTRAGICVWRDGKLAPYEFNADSLGRNPEFLGVYEDRHKNLWAFGDTYLINLADSLGNRLNNFRRGDLSSSRLWSFCETRDGRLWVGTSGQGLLQFTGDASQPFRPVTVRSGKLSKDVRTMCEDSEGNLWLGTDNNGLIQLRQERLRFFGAAEGISSSPISCIAADAEKRLWAAFANGQIFSGDGQRFELRSELSGTKFVSSMAGDSTGNLWLGFAGFGVDCWHGQQLVTFGPPGGLEDEFISAIIADGTTVCAGSRSGKVFEFQNDHWHLEINAKSPISALFTVDPGEFYVGTESGRVFLFSSNQMTEVVTTNSTGGYRINGLCFDKSGRLWVATGGNGLVCCAEHEIRNWKAIDGLPADDISSLIADARGNFWLTTEKGIYRLESAKYSAALQSGRFASVHQIVSFPAGANTPMGRPCALQSPDGLLWFGTSQGLVRFDPREWEPDDNPPSIYLESVAVNGETPVGFKKFISMTGKPVWEKLKLSSRVRSLDFDFTSPGLTIPEKTLFRHRLEGFDEDWIEGDFTSRKVHYGGLSSGIYCFRVVACNADGTWNYSGASFSFIVPPPWWRTPWAMATFILCTALLAAVGVRFVSHRRLQRKLRALEQSQAMSRERMRIAQHMHDEIGSKLARISYLSAGLNNELEEIEAHSEKAGAIADTSHDLLQSLDQMVWAVNPRNDTLENLVAYFGQYATEYFQNTAVGCNVRLPNRLPPTPLSAEARHNLLLAFEEALGNALKHSHATAVTVEIKFDNQALEIAVNDNGTGFGPAEFAVASSGKNGRSRHGLSGMKQRLQLLGGECRWSSAVGSGTVVNFTLPLKNNFGETR